MKKSIALNRRRAGIALPLSGIRSTEDLGCGDMGSAVPFLDWMRHAGLSVLQLLPLNDLAPGDSCPYSSISAFALDPVYADLARLPEIASSPSLRSSLSKETRTPPAKKLHASRRVRFPEVRRLKMRWLKRAYARFKTNASSRRRRELSAFRRRQRAWLDDYSLFRAIQDERGWRPWRRWPVGLRERGPKALAAAGRRLRGSVGFYAYAQWALHEQWKHLRREAGLKGILIFGDVPFGLSADSADVWARRRDFDLKASMGAPPDQYSLTGQAWGLPAYRWSRMEDGGHRWWRRRIRHASVLFDFFRIDHAVGFFRTWRTAAGDRKAGFDIRGARRQRLRGLRFFRMAVREGRPARPIAEDLGVIPPFVRKVLGKLRIPGYKVTRWERAGKKGFRDPRRYPFLSIATTGNHDTSTIAAWWGDISRAKRKRYWNTVVGVRGPAPRYSPQVHVRLLESAFEAKSAFAILSVQDLFGTRERINVPGTVSARNWTYRMPWEAESLAAGESMDTATRMIRRLSVRSGRVPTAHGGGTSSR